MRKNETEPHNSKLVIIKKDKKHGLSKHRYMYIYLVIIINRFTYVPIKRRSFLGTNNDLAIKTIL